MITVKCPAKVNLTLKIKGKRSNGYHDIESVMQTIGLYDYITVVVSQAEKFSIQLSGDSSEIPYNEKNIAYKAAKLFIERYRNISKRAARATVATVYINIEKNIPVAAGLAGGSSDAAGTIFALNEQFERPFSHEQLHEMCAKLGSDLNVCLEGGKLLCKGRGEIIEPLEYKQFNISLIKPKNLGISSKEAYAEFSKKTEAFPDLLGKRDEYANDLEWAVIDKYKELQKIKKLYPSAQMTGSGSVYFMINKEFDELDGYDIFNNLKSENQGIHKEERGW